MYYSDITPRVYVKVNPEDGSSMFILSVSSEIHLKTAPTANKNCLLIICLVSLELCFSRSFRFEDFVILRADLRTAVKFRQIQSRRNFKRSILKDSASM